MLQTHAQAEVSCLRDQPVLFVTFEKGPKTTIRVVKDVYRSELSTLSAASTASVS